jgi:multicomponent Na+:H+ antiporter subunit F
MHTWVQYVALVSLTALVGVLAVRATRASTTFDRALALDVLSLVFVAALSTFGIHRGRTGYLDIALMLALLSFLQTVATAHYAAHRRITP